MIKAPTMHSPNRRGFLRSSVAAGTATLALPAIARSASGANDRIRVATIGVSHRGRHHLNSVQEMAEQNVELAAICDVNEPLVGSRADNVEKQLGRKVSTFTDMRKLFEDKSIDAVTIATPDHWHTLAAIWACQAGKDVYVEKPCSHNIFEGRKLVEAARKYKRIVQHGTQCRTSPNIIEAVDMLNKGVIGDVYMVRAIAFKVKGNMGRHEPTKPPAGFNWDMWLGPAPRQEYSKFRRGYGWHYLWDFGTGETGNQGVHQLDIIRWALNLKSHPTRIQSMAAPLVPHDDTEIPKTQQFACEFGERKLLLQFECRNWYSNCEGGMGDKFPFVDGRSAAGVVFFGVKGYMVIPDFSSYHTFLGNQRKPGPSKRLQGSPMLNTPHFRNWAAAMRSRKIEDANAEIEQGHLSSAICHLANIAYRTGRTLRFDPKAERFVDDDQANGLLSRDYREPFIVPETV